MPVEKGVKRYPGYNFQQTSDVLYPNENKSRRPLNMEARYYFWHFDYRNRGEPEFMKMYNKARCNSVGNNGFDYKPNIQKHELNSSFDNGYNRKDDTMNLRARNDRCNSVENERPSKRRYFGNVDRKGYRQFGRSRSAVCLSTLE